MDLSDSDLIRAALEGDEDAFTDLVTHHWTAVFALIRRLVSAVDGDCEQLTIDTFLKVRAALGTFELDRSFRPWLLRVATNVVRDWWRQRQRQQRREAAEETPPLLEQVGAHKQLARHVFLQSVRWSIRYTDKKAARKIRRGALLRLLGCEYRRVAEGCGYRSAECARVVITTGIARALSQPTAHEEARAIQATGQRVFAVHGRPFPFLNVVDVERLPKRMACE